MPPIITIQLTHLHSKPMPLLIVHPARKSNLVLEVFFPSPGGKIDATLDQPVCHGYSVPQRGSALDSRPDPRCPIHTHPRRGRKQAQSIITAGTSQSTGITSYLSSHCQHHGHSYRNHVKSAPEVQISIDREDRSSLPVLLSDYPSSL